MLCQVKQVFPLELKNTRLLMARRASDREDSQRGAGAEYFVSEHLRRLVKQ